jgi:hypothetical protein
MKTLVLGVIGVLGIVLCARDLVSGLRTGAMRTLAHYSPVAERSEKPRLFWFFVAINVAVITAMTIVLVDLALRNI